MNYYPLRKNEISFHFVQLNVAINLPSALYFFCSLKMGQLAETWSNEY